MEMVDVVENVVAENAEAVAENAINEVSSSTPDLIPATVGDIKKIVYDSNVKAGATGAVTVIGLGALGYGIYRGIRWLVGKVKANKERQESEPKVVND